MIYGYTYISIYKECEKIFNVCKKLGVDTIAGPASSGVSVAVAVFMVSNSKEYPLNALLLGKKGYVRHKHSSGIKYLGNSNKMKNVLVVDDIVSSGESMLYALNEIKDGDLDVNIIGCLSNSFSYSAMSLIKEADPNIRIFCHGYFQGCYEEMINNEGGWNTKKI